MSSEQTRLMRRELANAYDAAASERHRAELLERELAATRRKLRRAERLVRVREDMRHLALEVMSARRDSVE